MADLPTNITAGVTTGHATDHANLAAWLNALGFDEGQSILNHIGFPGDSTQFLAGDGAFRVPAGGGGGGATGFTAGMGHQYVLASGGSNANNGISPLSAKATIQAAHDALPSTGGTIWLSEGVHTISATTNISKRGVALIGAGRTASRVKCGTAGIHMIHWTGADGFCQNFVVTDGSSDFAGPLVGRGLSGIWLDNAQEMVMVNVRFDGFGIGAATGLSFDAGPAGLRINTPTAFGDWMYFFGLIFRRCYRGASITSGNNGHFIGCAFYSDGEERVRLEKRTATGGDSSSFQFVDCHFAGSGQANRWSVVLEHGTGATSPYRLGVGFTHCKFELSAATTGLGGVYVNGSEVFFDNTVISSGSIPSVRCGPDAAGVRFGQYIGPDPRLEVSTGNTGAMRSWRPTDDTGTSANGAIATV